MKNYTCLILCLWLSFHLTSQVVDDFEDADLSLDPSWGGMPGSFTTVNGELRSNHSVLNSVFYLSTPSAYAVGSEWRLDCRLLFNTSSVNYIDVMLIADSMNLLTTKNGYFIRMGGSTDEISLYKLKNGTETRIIDGVDGTLNSSNNHYLLILQRFNDSFVLKRAKSGGSLVTEGSVRDADILVSAYSGLRIRQSTASFVNKHFFDNLYIGPVIRDSIAPVCDSLVLLSHRQLKCVISEPCDSLSMVDTNHYMILQGNIRPASVLPDAAKKSVILQFDKPFLTNTSLNLIMHSIADKSGNKMAMQSRTFYDSRPDTAHPRDLIITELMADPDPQVALPIAEYVEITNVSGKFIQLNGCRMYDPTSFKSLPNAILAPDSIMVLKVIPSLNNAEDKIWLSNQRGELVHKVDYTDQWYKDEAKKAGGYSLEMIDYSKPCIGIDNWMASNDISGGTPGRLNSVKGNIPKDTIAPSVVRYTMDNDSTLVFYLSEPVDSASLLSVSFAVNGKPALFKLKRLNSKGDKVTWVIPFLPDETTVYTIEFSGLTDCSGNRQVKNELLIQWPSQSRKGNLLINEVLFNPGTGGKDFVEIYNHSDLAFDLSAHFLAEVDAVGQLKNIYTISPAGLIVRPHQYVLVSEDTANICSEYACSNPEALKIQMARLPSMPDDKGGIVLLNLQNLVIDSLHYSRDWHFPLISDQNGVSLERLSFGVNTNIRDNWHSAASTAGYATPGFQNSQFMVPYKTDEYFAPQSKTLSPDEDGFEDVMVLRYTLPGSDYIATIIIYDLEGRMIRHLVNNKTLGTDGIITWDGTDENAQKVPIGIYIVWIECINADGQRIRQKMSIVVAGRI